MLLGIVALSAGIKVAMQHPGLRGHHKDVVTRLLIGQDRLRKPAALGLAEILFP